MQTHSGAAHPSLGRPLPSPAPSLRLGVYGGTFDPPHLGHLILAETATDSLHLAQVIFVPAADPPHKAPTAIRAAAEHRAAMVTLAIAGNPHFALSRVDLDRPGPHYSVEMLRLLKQQHLAADLVFLIGADSLAALPSWSRPQELIQIARLGVMRRLFNETDLVAIEAQIPGISERIDWVDAPLIDIAASDLAARIAAGRSVRYQLPDTVYDYIQQHGLYRKNS